MATSGIDDLPGQQVLPVARDDAHDVSDVVGVVVPVARRGMAELVDQDRRPPLGQEEQGEAGRQDLISSRSAQPPQNPESLFCSWTSSSAPRRYQSFWPKNRMPASRPARSRP